LEIANCQLRAAGPKPTAAHLDEVKKSLSLANNILDKLDPLTFDADEQRVYYSIGSLQRRMTVGWLGALTDATNGAIESPNRGQPFATPGTPFYPSEPTGCLRRLFLRRGR
jgi:hypothetical protein